MPVKRYSRWGSKLLGHDGLADIELTETTESVVAGAAPLGTASYPIPTSNVMYVSTTGNNNNNGFSEASPKATLDAAYAACSAGWTIILRAGTYRQRFTNNIAKALTIQNYPGEAVTVDGSDLFTSWTFNSGNNTWTTPFTANLSRMNLSGYNGTSALRGHGDQVFYDGAPLVQVADTAVPGAGQFAVDQTLNTLTIGSDPTGHTVEATTRSVLSTAITEVGVMRGFRIRRFSPPFIDGSTNGFLYVAGNATGYVFENMIFTDSNVFSLSTARRADVQNCTFERMGAGAISGTTSDGMVIKKSVIRDCNRRLWAMQPVVGGIKMTRSRDLVIEDNYVANVRQAGHIWLDISCLGHKVVRNVVYGPTESAYVPKSVGIEVELSDGGFYGSTQHWGIVAGNHVSGCETGFTNYNSGYIALANNDLRNNRYSIYIWQDSRWNDGRDVADSRGTATEAPWYANHQRVMNNISSQHPSYSSIQMLAYQVAALRSSLTAVPVPPNLLGIDMFDHFGGHWFAPAPPGTAVQLGRGIDLRNSYNSPAAIMGAGSDVGGPWGAKLGNLSNATTQPIDSFATPLPADIAAALGVLSGTQKVGPVTPPPIPSY